MKIGIDARSMTHPQRGGFKTYGENLLQALARLDEENHYRLYVTRQIPSHSDLSELGHPIVSVSNSLPVVSHVFREQIQMPLRVRADQCDMVHFLSNTAPLICPARLIVTLHDVIPLTEPQLFGGSSLKAMWQWGIWAYSRYVIPQVVRRADAVITVSGYEKAQIVRLLGVPADKVFVTHLAASPTFSELPTADEAPARAHLERHYGIDKPFVLAVGYEPRKNIGRVIRAFCLLDRRLRENMTLVIVSAHSGAREALRQKLLAERIERVKIVGSLSPEELRLFYACAELLVFASLRESFGLPPLEAMACGTPVVASKASSLPEVLGDAALLVPPRDVEAIVAAMARVLTTPWLSQELRDRGLQRTRMFSWGRTARETIAAYRQAAASPRRAMSSGTVATNDRRE